MAQEQITRLKILLLEDGKPQYQIAGACGIHPSRLSMYALGQSPIPRQHLRALAKHFGVRQQDVLGWESVEWDDA